MNDENRWYLVIVQFNAGREDLIERLRRDKPIIEGALKKLSGDCVQPVVYSSNGQVVAWALRTRANSRQITSRLQNPEGSGGVGRFHATKPPDTLRHGDKTFVFQLGADRCLNGVNVIQNWFDKNWPVTS